VDTVRCVANLASTMQTWYLSHCLALKGKIVSFKADANLRTSNKFSKRWNSHRSSWNTVNLSNDQEQVPLLHHVVHEHKIEKKPKISEYFIVMFVEQPSYDYLDICEDKWLNKISAIFASHLMIDLPLFRRCSWLHFCFGAPFFLLSFIALSSRCVF